MSLKWKLAISFALLAALAVVAATTISYFSTKSELYRQIDSSLLNATGGVSRIIFPSAQSTDTKNPDTKETNPGIGEQKNLQGAPEEATGAQKEPGVGDVFSITTGVSKEEPDAKNPLRSRLFVYQVINSRGDVIRTGAARLPVDEVDLSIASFTKTPPAAETTLRSSTVGETSVRVITYNLSRGGALQVARSLEETEETLGNLRTRYLLLVLLSVGGAALIGLLLATGVSRRLEKLTSSAEEVAQSGVLDKKIDLRGKDEIGRLSRAFSHMLASLSESRRQQESLVQDAGHELRTPLTSMNTNLHLLDKWESLDEEDREAILEDLRSETGEMTSIVNDLVELTTVGEQEELGEVDISSIAEKAASKISRSSGRKIEVRGKAPSFQGRGRALTHAILNLLENAVKFDSSREVIEIEITSGQLLVLDRGPGVPPGKEKAIFERFHRTEEARVVPGSGLGLAIVQRVAEQHDGEGVALNRADGGAAIGFSWKTSQDRKPA